MAEIHNGVEEERGHIDFAWKLKGDILVARFHPHLPVEEMGVFMSDLYPGQIIRTKKGLGRAVVHVAALFGNDRTSQEEEASTYYAEKGHNAGYLVIGQTVNQTKETVAIERETSLNGPGSVEEKPATEKSKPPVSAPINQKIRTDMRSRRTDALHMSEEELANRFGTWHPGH